MAVRHCEIPQVTIMKRTLQVLGGIFAVLLLGIVAAFGYAAYVGSGLDHSSKVYVDESIPAIVSDWSKEELLRRASPQLLQVMNRHPGQLDQVFSKFSRLGSLRRYGGCKGEANIVFNLNKGKTVTAGYSADATFEHGDAHIAVRLIQTDGQWRILLFNVNSPIFLQ